MFYIPIESRICLYKKQNLVRSGSPPLTFLKRNKDLAVTPFDKGVGFVILVKKELKKAEADFKNVSLDTHDPITTFERKIQVTLRQLDKDGKMGDDEYKSVYLSGSITPSTSPAIKAHKPVKNYPARNIMSHIGSPKRT
jgi:hypothetical protein